LAALEEEFELLVSDPSIETTLLIHPNVLNDFYDYPNIDQVPTRNVELMNRLGVEKLRRLLAACFV
jgi:hypothetical protein